MAQDGRLKSVTVHGYQKRYDLEKYYTYILKVTRQNQPDPAYLFRSYKEFSEFHQKLCLLFPLSKLRRCVCNARISNSLNSINDNNYSILFAVCQVEFMSDGRISKRWLIVDFPKFVASSFHCSIRPMKLPIPI